MQVTVHVDLSSVIWTHGYTVCNIINMHGMLVSIIIIYYYYYLEFQTKIMCLKKKIIKLVL